MPEVLVALLSVEGAAGKLKGDRAVLGGPKRGAPILED